MGKIREATKMLWKFVGKLLNCGRKPMDFRTPNLRVKELFHPLQVDTRVLFGCSDFKKVFRHSLFKHVLIYLISQNIALLYYGYAAMVLPCPTLGHLCSLQLTSLQIFAELRCDWPLHTTSVAVGFVSRSLRLGCSAHVAAARLSTPPGSTSPAGDPFSGRQRDDVVRSGAA